MKKLFNWLLVSNRYKHLIIGVVILAIWIPACLILGMTWLQSVITGFATVTIAMASCEYKDKAHGCKWDWLDILAGALVPIILLFISWFVRV